jgi:hypothetical protein
MAKLDAPQSRKSPRRRWLPACSQSRSRHHRETVDFKLKKVVDVTEIGMIVTIIPDLKLLRRKKSAGEREAGPTQGVGPEVQFHGSWGGQSCRGSGGERVNVLMPDLGVRAPSLSVAGFNDPFLPR